jgi:regulator of sigma E protease
MLDQFTDAKQLLLQVKRGEKEYEVYLKAEEDKTWPMADRGVRLVRDLYPRRAQNLGQAIILGSEKAFSYIGLIYRQLKALVTGGLSAKNMSGPIGIFGTAYDAAENDIYTLILFLGIISVNLAVVNFLPIPVLDGGHMVFLIYEGLRGKPASEVVRAWATYAGLFVIASLMLFVIVLDVSRYFM